MTAAAAAAAARLTGHPVTAARPLSGTLTEADLGDGTTVMVKRGDAPGAVQAEAAGLAWLTAAGTVPLPAVRGHDGRWLVTERIPAGPPTAEAAARFGRGLAALHATGAPAFGAAPPGGPQDAYIGAAPMRNAVGHANDPSAGPSVGHSVGLDWPHWYAEHRVLPYLRLAVDAGVLGHSEAALVERVCDRLPGLAGPAEPPARLHGDLWNGNVLWAADGRAWLIDPAAHGGHRETDLAMLHLFGCPHLPQLLAAYDESAPLAPGWRARLPLHQLFPLLVHTVLFGRPYATQALEAARAALSES